MTHRSLPRAITLALALAAASLGPLLLPGTALAAAGSKDSEATPHAAKGDANETAKPAKRAPKAKGKAKKRGAAKATKAPAKATKASAKSGKRAGKATKTKRATRENKASPKRAKPTPKADDSPKAGKARAQAACSGTAVSLDRGGVEEDTFALVDCHAKPLGSAVAKVSLLARPWGAPRRAASSPRVDAGVITRLAAIAKKLPGKTITLMGGPRPSSNGAGAHQDGRAVDVHVEGVDDKKLAEICRSLSDTGCGYYPNASFVHIDVRAKGAGKAYWIDVSEPGEPPRYVTSWPPASASKSETVKASVPAATQK